jgi:hypothetical protein
MLDFNDIRAGNQVLFKASGSTVTILKVENNAVLLDTFPQSSYCSNTDISGVTLTTAMLKKLSFENEENKAWVGEGVTIHEKEDGLFYGLRIGKSRAKIQYLHQLQNYVTDFYALFREKDHSLDISYLTDLPVTII